jgi:hypothetical protein
VSKKDTNPVGDTVLPDPVTVPVSEKLPALPLEAIDVVLGKVPVTVSVTVLDVLPASSEVLLGVPTNTAL